MVSLLLLCILMLLILFLLGSSRKNCTRILYSYHIKLLRSLSSLLLWYIFCTNAVLIETIYIVLTYDYDLSKEIEGKGGKVYAIWLFILIGAICLILIPYLLKKLFEDFIKIIVFGETCFGDFILKMIITTKSTIRGRIFYLFCLFKISLWTAIYSLLYISSDIFTPLLRTAYCVI